jgi:hypothetical protein
MLILGGLNPENKQSTAGARVDHDEEAAALGYARLYRCFRAASWQLVLSSAFGAIRIGWCPVKGAPIVSRRSARIAAVL